MSFFEQLQTASLGGVPFGVLAASGRFGRRQAIHEYPYRETCWVEDMGKSARRIGIVGFLVENDTRFKNGDVISQRERLIGIAESPGVSTLVHPTLGTLEVSLLALRVSEKWDNGKYFEVHFSFIEAGKRVFPAITTDSHTTIKSDTLSAYAAAASDFVLKGLELVHKGEWVIQTAIKTIDTWGAIVRSAVQDATNLFNMVSNLPQDISNSFGRFFGGSKTGFTGSVTSAVSSSTTLSDLVKAGSTTRQEIENECAALTSAANTQDPEEITTAVQVVVDLLVESVSSPADGIRLFADLAMFSVVGIDATATTIKNYLNLSIVISIALSVAEYYPSSADDAYAIRKKVSALIDEQITIAGDNGDDATFLALRQLRLSVVTDLNKKGAAMPSLMTINVGTSLPSSVLALRLYRDPSRATEIEMETGAPHPAFQPTTMTVLAS